MNVYLARPIDRSKDDPIKGYQEMIGQLVHGLAGLPVAIFAPGLAWSLCGTTDHQVATEITETNMHALQLADMVVLDYLDGVSTWGVPMEALIAFKKDIVTFVLSDCDYNNLPINLKAMVTPEQVCYTMPELIELIIAGLEALESKRRKTAEGTRPETLGEMTEFLGRMLGGGHGHTS